VVLSCLHAPPPRPKSWIASTAAMPRLPHESRLPLSPRISPPPPPQISSSPLSQVLNPSTTSSPTASAAAALPRQTQLQGDSSRRRDNIFQRREAVRDPAAGAHQGQRLHRQQRRRAGLPPATSGSPEATTTAHVPSPSVTPTPSSPRQVRSRLSLLLPTRSWTTEDVAASSPSPQQSRQTRLSMEGTRSPLLHGRARSSTRPPRRSTLPEQCISPFYRQRSRPSAWSQALQMVDSQRFCPSILSFPPSLPQARDSRRGSATQYRVVDGRPPSTAPASSAHH
jgi:hypothetical protein